MIRKASEKDIEAIGRLLEQVLLIHHDMRPDLFKEQGAKYTREQLREIINDPLKPIFVYVDGNGRVLGHLFAQIIHSEETFGAYAHTTMYLDDICIDEQHRHRAIGTALFEYVEEYARQNGIYSISAHVWDGNEKSMSLCRKRGFTPQKTVMEKIIQKDRTR